jgi:hypothetical protein
VGNHTHTLTLSSTPPTEAICAVSRSGSYRLGVLMLEFLTYAVFGIVMFGCLWYIMGSLETEGAPEDRNP